MGTDLRAVMVGRNEHHLVVVARVGGAVLECAVAGEPLAFAHRNISDEYAILLPTGDPLLDAFQGRTFIGDDGRVKHGAGDLVLNPYGAPHWPGKLRPPYTPLDLPVRPRVLSLVLCAARPCPPGDRPLGATPGREADLKADAALVDTRRHAEGLVGVVADARLELVRGPRAVDGPGVIVDLDRAVLETLPAAFQGARGLALVGAPVLPPPPIPAPPFAYQAAPLPISVGDLTLRAVSDTTVRAGDAEIPRHWLARMLFRVALHGLRLGHVETYGGFFCEDREDLVLGVRGAALARVPRERALEVLEELYCAVAPPGYVEV